MVRRLNRRVRISRFQYRRYLSSPESQQVAYALSNPLGFVDINGAGPVDTTWLKIFTGVYAAITRSHLVKSILRIPIPPEKWGDWHVGKAGDHTILSAQRPRFPGVRDDQQFIAKIDRPNPDSDLSMQRIYHYRVG